MKKDLALGIVNELRTEYGLLNPSLGMPEVGLEGDTFIIVDGKQKNVAKLYDDNLRAETVTQFQDRLFSAHVPVPAIVLTKSGRFTTRLGEYTLVLFEFVYGKPIGWGKEFASLSGPLSGSIASAVGSMHRVSQTMKLEAKLDHPLSVTRIISSLKGDLGVWRLRDDLSHVRQAMIHSDLTRENVFIAKAQDSIKAIIDFGDAHYDYITYDLATLLTQVFVTKSWGIDFQGIKEFLLSYCQLNQLSPAELRTILPLMKLRNKGLLQEVKRRLDENDADRATLESIKQSLGVKLQLLEDKGRRLEDLILSS